MKAKMPPMTRMMKLRSPPAAPMPCPIKFVDGHHIRHWSDGGERPARVVLPPVQRPLWRLTRWLELTPSRHSDLGLSKSSDPS